MAKKEIKVREIAPDEIKLDDRNLNRHTDKGRDLVNKSFSELGAGRSGVSDRNGKMIAGNLSIETAIEKGLKIVEVETEGDTYIVVKRKDLDLDSTTDNRARKLALADNSTAAVSLEWDFEEMQTQAEEFGFELGEWGVEVPEEIVYETEEPEGGATGPGGETERKSLEDRFLIPPFSIFDTRKGYWQNRKRQWLAIGIQSELGRGGHDVQRSPMAEGEIRKGSSGDKYATTYKNQDKLMSYFKK